MKVHCLQHVPYEDLAAISKWLDGKAKYLAYTRLYAGDRLPKIESFDWLFIMGGPMSVNDEEKFLWLNEEKEFIKKCIKKGKIIIGICLGAQLIASTLGFSVYRNNYKEIGWYKISFLYERSGNPFFSNFPENLTVFHWHGETFDLPKGADLLASSEACKNQIFMVGHNVFGLQCHLEFEALAVKKLMINSKEELIPDKYVQPAQKILENTLKYSGNSNHFLFTFLDRLHERHDT